MPSNTWWLLLVWSGSSSSLSIATVVSSRDFKVTVGRSHALVQVVGWSRLLYFGSHQWGQETMFMPGYPCFWQSFMGLFINLEKIVGQLWLSLNMHHCCCLPSRFTFAQCFAVRIFPFCPNYPLLRHTDGKDKVFHFEDSVTGAEVDPWLGYHGWLLPQLLYGTYPPMQYWQVTAPQKGNSSAAMKQKHN